MPIERLASLVFAVALIAVALIGAPVPIPDGWDKVAHFAGFSALTVCLWHATGGQMPILVIAGAILFGVFDEWRQAYLPDRTSDAKDFLADFCAVVATGALLFMQRKSVCAESSPQ